MQNITINCKNCGKNNKCEIRRAFIETASKFDTIINNYTIKFQLKCPLKISKFKRGQKVNFTIGTNRYIRVTEWECDKREEYCSCNNDCVDGIVTFKNNAYKNYIKLTGIFYDQYNSDKAIIAINLNKFNNIKNQLIGIRQI